MKLIMIKLVTGDVVMGRVSDESTDTTLNLSKPFQLIMDPVQGGVGMIPYNAIYTQVEMDDCDFDRNFIMEELEIHQSFEDAYIKQTTGIDTQLPEIEVG